jgi:hypothetical protein
MLLNSVWSGEVRNQPGDTLFFSGICSKTTLCGKNHKLGFSSELNAYLMSGGMKYSIQENE